MSAVRVARLAFGAALALAAPAPAMAGTKTASFQVGAAIVNGCTVATDAAGRWGAIDLGTVAGTGGASASGTLLSGGVAGLRLTCTPGATVSVTADAGDHATSGQRRLAGAGGGTIPYVLHADGAAAPWTTQAVSVAFPVGTSARTLPVTATATLAGALLAGTYTDTVRITLSF